MSGRIFLVICVDAEGPLYESSKECILRINRLFDLDLPLGQATLQQILDGTIDLGGREGAIRSAVSPGVRDWLGDWGGVDKNVDFACSDRFRRGFVDDSGRNVVLNWFVCDWVGFRHNPRRKPVGLNLVSDCYFDRFGINSPDDPIYFHHHAEPFSGCTHHPCKNWSNEPSHIEKLSSCLLKHGHFPACVRSPIMAPDIHWFLEQYFPFDLSNTAVPLDGQPDVASKRWTDWTRAPEDWSLYQPDIYDYQTPGDMKRTIGRCMQYGSRYGNFDANELRRAVLLAESGEDVLVSLYVHDHSPFEKLFPVFQMFESAREQTPAVAFHNASAVEAFREVLGIVKASEPCFEVRLEGSSVLIETNDRIFGTQPWFCFETASGDCCWDNLDVIEIGKRWRYVMDSYTFPLSSVARLGIAANNAAGCTATQVFRLENQVLVPFHQYGKEIQC